MPEIPQHDDSQETGGVPSTPSSIEAKAEASIDNVYEFLTQHGVEPPKKRPKVRYSDMPCPLNDRAIATANVDIESMKEILTASGAVMMRAAYARFGLHVSDDAILEAIEVGKNELSEVINTSSIFQGADITLFPMVANEMHKLDSVMGHEIWHLKEDEEELLNANSLLREATATYVENLIAGKNSANPEVRDHFDVIYKYGASVVEEELGDTENPLQALLNPTVREKLESKFQEKVIPLHKQKIEETFDPSMSETWQRQTLRTHEAYEAFRQESSGENYLVALRKRGYKKLAEEFAKQNMNPILEYSRRLLT